MSIKGKLWLMLRNKLPKKFFPTSVAYLFLDHIEPSVFMDNWSSLPFNGQVRRMRLISGLSLDLEIGTVIETGTYLGSSTPYLARIFNCETYSVEIDPYFAQRAKRRFENNHKDLDIELIVGDSAQKIREILFNVSKSNSIFAYLDAHWLDAIPTEDELNALIEWGGDWLAVIDDFQIELDSGYKFDSYDSVVIGLNLIPVDEHLEVWVPKEDSKLETGVRSGTGIVFSSKSHREKVSENLISQMMRIR
ncbi:putative methyltransferase [Candidatus Planktophila lacus]|uniref:class I SAM-dependent methyltransferase n=1 Tax=Candidatus Planktophila lacus TaxID=1884913 RepID=UPI000BACE252|nr:class I SAM-dependent methyltransferase [Candidatus Planktophila lacus]ASY24509.1 putative methyltransferase [Candidatus Planktophila lacus]